MPPHTTLNKQSMLLDTSTGINNSPLIETLEKMELSSPTSVGKADKDHIT